LLLQLPGEALGVFHVGKGTHLYGESHALQPGTLSGAAGGNRRQEQQSYGDESDIF
jgi:hypothetical protein